MQGLALSVEMSIEPMITPDIQQEAHQRDQTGEDQHREVDRVELPPRRPLGKRDRRFEELVRGHVPSRCRP